MNIIIHEPETSFKMTQIVDIMENINCDDNVKNALIAYDFKEATPEMLSKFVKFSDKEEVTMREAI